MGCRFADMCIYRTQTVLTHQSQSLCSTEYIHHGTQSCIIQRTCVTQAHHEMHHSHSICSTEHIMKYWHHSQNMCSTEHVHSEHMYCSQNKYITENIFTYVYHRMCTFRIHVLFSGISQNACSQRLFIIHRTHAAKDYSLFTERMQPKTIPVSYTHLTLPTSVAV